MRELTRTPSRSPTTTSSTFSPRCRYTPAWDQTSAVVATTCFTDELFPKSLEASICMRHSTKHATSHTFFLICTLSLRGKERNKRDLVASQMQEYYSRNGSFSSSFACNCRPGQRLIYIHSPEILKMLHITIKNRISPLTYLGTLGVLLALSYHMRLGGRQYTSTICS